MKISQRILKVFHPKDEQERMKYRFEAARALAELEDLNRTVSLNGFEFKELIKFKGMKVR